jgi:hypothetical protein
MGQGKRKKSVARATLDPLNIGVAAGAATLAIGMGSVAIGALGALAYGAMVAYDALVPGRNQTDDRDELPDPEKIADPDTRAAVAKINTIKQEIDRVLAETPADVRANLAETLASIKELDGYAARLVARAEDIAKYLVKVDFRGLVAEIKQLGTRIDATNDPAAKQQFTDARATRMDELRTLKELKAARDRVDAGLAHLVAVLGALPTKIVHMRALDAQAVDKLSGDLNAELATVGRELKSSEEVMKTLGEITS